MNIWRIAGITGIAAAVISFAGLFINYINKKVTLYNAEYVIQSAATKGNVTMDLISGMIEKRLKEGNFNYNLKQIASHQLLINLKKIKDTVSIKNLLTSNGRVQFWEIYTIEEMIEAVKKVNEYQRNQLKAKFSDYKEPDSMDLLAKRENQVLSDIDIYQLIYINHEAENGSLGIVKLKDTSILKEIYLKPEIKKLFPQDVKLLLGHTYNSDSITQLYAIKTNENFNKASLENADLEYCYMDMDMNGKPQLSLKFNDRASLLWSRMTRSNIGKILAIVYNDHIISAPRVNSEIVSGQTTLNGDFTIDECQLMASMINAEPLPAGITIKSAIIKKIKPHLPFHFFLVPVITFLLFFILGFFVAKALKPK